MITYAAYGLRICSALPLPELATAEGEPDIYVRFGAVAGPPPRHPPLDYDIYATADEIQLYWRDVGRFSVKNGREIAIDPITTVEERTLRLFVLGPALAIVLHQRGYLVLHASATELHGHAVAFLGGSGWGKSTMAAVLHGRGHNFLADDFAVIRQEASGPMLFPGFPQLKLWPESLVSLGHDPEAVPRLRPEIDKRAFHIAGAIPDLPQPLGRIYVLAEGPHPQITPLGRQESFVELVRHSYAIHLVGATGAATHFYQCAKVSDAIPLFRLNRPRSLRILAEVAALVEADNALGGR